MGKKVRSAKGEVVDFDLLRIKEQIASAPPPQDVKLRKDFIENRLRRRIKKATPPAPAVKIDKQAEEVSADAETVEEKPTTRQKARPPKN